MGPTLGRFEGIGRNFVSLAILEKCIPKPKLQKRIRVWELCLETNGCLIVDDPLLKPAMAFWNFAKCWNSWRSTIFRPRSRSFP